jgi:hypothetical protein
MRLAGIPGPEAFAGGVELRYFFGSALNFSTQGAQQKWYFVPPNS